MKKKDKDDPRAVTLQVQRVNGQWETVFGGEPPVRDGALAELTLLTSALHDSDFKRLLSQQAAGRHRRSAGPTRRSRRPTPRHPDAMKSRNPKDAP